MVEIARQGMSEYSISGIELLLHFPWTKDIDPGRDFSPNLKQDLSGLSGFLRQLRSKSCFKISGLSGFERFYLKKPLKNRARFEQF